MDLVNFLFQSINVAGVLLYMLLAFWIEEIPDPQSIFIPIPFKDRLLNIFHESFATVIA